MKYKFKYVLLNMPHRLQVMHVDSWSTLTLYVLKGHHVVLFSIQNVFVSVHHFSVHCHAMILEWNIQ